MPFRPPIKGRREHSSTSYRQPSELSAPEWWAVLTIAAVGVVLSPLLDVTQTDPDEIAAVVDAVFCVTFVIAARWPWAGLLVYAIALAVSFPLGERETILSAVALSSCVIVRVGSIKVIAGFFVLMAGGLTIVATTGEVAPGALVLAGIPFLALVSSTIGAVLRSAFGRERRLESELQQRVQAEREIRDEERQLIADELHDDIAHDLTVISTYLSVLERQGEEGVDKATSMLAISVLGNTTRKVLDDLRLIMRQGAAVDGQSVRALPVAFADARRELAAANLQVEVDGDPEDERVSRLVSATLSRTLREAVTNILKHQGRSPVHIGLSVIDSVVCFEITNRLPAVRSEADPGFGTTRISERVAHLGGSCVIGPDGDFWVVSVRIPCHTQL